MNGRRPHKWVIAGTVLTGTVMAVLDSSIVNVALPDMSGTLGATIEEITWVVTGYILANVIIMPIIGLLSARFGRKRFYIANVVLFTAASMLCGVARTLPLMVAFRVLQGIGGGVLITVSQAILRESFPASEQGVAMGIYGMGVVLAPAIGPTLGGWLTDQYSWPWIFYINVPVGILCVTLIARFIEDPPYLVRERGRLDVSGLALMTVGLGALQLLLEKGEQKDWFESRLIVTLAAVAAVGLALFVWRELTAKRPAVDLRLMRNVSFSSATMLGGVLGMGLYGTLFLLPLFLQRLLGFPAMDSGLALMPRSLAMAVVMPVSGRLYNRLGPRLLVASGLLVSAFSFYQLSHLTLDMGAWDLFWPQVWQGVGFGLIFVALSTAALATIERPKMTAAAGLYNVVRQVFGSVGIAVAATQLTANATRFRASLSEHVTAFDDATRQWLSSAMAGVGGAASAAGDAGSRALALLDLHVTREAMNLAYGRAFVLVAILFVAALPLALFLPARSEGTDAEGETTAAEA
ncbi:MAG TPA: DHA2 family efflux MFS transporter permease subunit [Candidatus Eisenbacteria bacterium]